MANGLDLNDIQGNVLAGFNKDHQAFLLLSLPSTPAAACAWLKTIVDEVATTEEVTAFNQLFKALRGRRGKETGVIEATWMNLAFTRPGLEALGVTPAEIAQFPDDFRQGLKIIRDNLGPNRASGVVGSAIQKTLSPWLPPNAFNLYGKVVHALGVVDLSGISDPRNGAAFLAATPKAWFAAQVIDTVQDTVEASQVPIGPAFPFIDAFGS